MRVGYDDFSDLCRNCLYLVDSVGLDVQAQHVLGAACSQKRLLSLVLRQHLLDLVLKTCGLNDLILHFSDL